jgi:8-oxo-dGTP pyrophosphatase MutT (NUDIX family)
MPDIKMLPIRIGIYGLCIRDNKILMVKTQSGSLLIYNFPGGGIEENESFAETLQRECAEEIGCRVMITGLHCASDRLYKHPDFDYQSLHLYYTIALDDEIDPSIQDAHWFPLNDLPLDMMLDVDRAIIKSLQ